MDTAKHIGRPRRGTGTIKRSVTMQESAWSVVDDRATGESRSRSAALERIVMEWAEQAREESGK